MRDVAIIGTGMTHFGELWDSSLRSMFADAALEALDLAPDEVDGGRFDEARQRLAAAREDLIDLLIEKRVIMFTELPPAAQEKLLSRRRAREMLRDTSSVMLGVV